MQFFLSGVDVMERDTDGRMDHARAQVPYRTSF